MDILVTGSSGLIGSEAVEHFAARGHNVFGVDNNMRADFFGPQGDTSWRLARLKEAVPGFTHHAADIRDRKAMLHLFAERQFGAVIHCAAQPSHDLAKSRPFDDFDVNAVGTLNLLEAARQHCPEAPFVFMSTNKVYGDAPNELALVETPTRWDYADPGPLRRHRRDDAHRPEQAQPVRRLKGGGRRHGAGIRPLFRHADGVLPRRLPYRAQPQRRRTARLPRISWSRLRCPARRTRSSATRESRFAIRFIRATSSAPSKPSSPRRASAKSTISAAVARATPRSWNASRRSKRSQAARSRGAMMSRTARATTSATSRTWPSSARTIRPGR